MKKPNYLPLGEVSHATMRGEDLVPTFLDLCESVILSKNSRRTIHVIKRRMRAKNYFKPILDSGKYNTHYWATDDCFTLMDILNEYCFPYCYFGSLEGDSACYGVWADINLLMDDIRNGEIHEMDKAPKGYRGYVVCISDHGNVTLYNRRAFGHGYKDVEVWGVV